MCTLGTTCPITASRWSAAYPARDIEHRRLLAGDGIDPRREHVGYDG
jgi:hypothetical protein